MKMNAKKIRLTSQIVFFAFFFLLIIKSEYSGFSKGGENIKLPYPVSVFLEIDPLISIGTLISSHTVYQNLIFSLITIILTLFFGRFFCGWICPFGTFNHFVSSFNSGKLKGKGRLDTNQYKSWQKIKYYFLIFFLISSFFSTIQIGILDPICLMTRTFGTVIMPAFNYSIVGIANSFTETDISFLQEIGSYILAGFQKTLISYKAVHFNSTFLISLIFLVIIISNRYITRFWCRAVCPLGALLGAMSKYSILGLEKNEKVCTKCNRCELYCQGGDNPMPGKKWHISECHLCLNCIDECPENSLKFKLFPDRESVITGTDITKRHVITSIAFGAAVVPLLRSEAGLDVNYNHKLIRPPSSIEEKEFLAKCVKCGACMKVCPNNAIHPTLFEAGIEGLWSPILIPRIGYCEPSCTLCSTVCPTGAINEITPLEKGWVNQDDEEKKISPVKIGLSFIDRGRCLPWAMNTQCIVCEEWCPTSPKSIYLDETDTFNRDGEMIHLKRPVIDPSHCVGCGACEYACPIEDKPAISVTSIGETRSKNNQILLREGK